MLDGSIYIQPGGYLGLPRPTAPVTVTIGGQTARQLYIGPAPYRVFGMLQVNAVIPEGVESGNQPVVLAVGDRDNSAQHVVIAVE